MIIYLISTIIFINIVWFETEALVEYVKLFKLNWFKITEYLIAKESNFELTYHSYLSQHHRNFFTKLITCPICLTTWLSIISSLLFTESILDFSIIFVLSIIGYNIYRKLLV